MHVRRRRKIAVLASNRPLAIPLVFMMQTKNPKYIAFTVSLCTQFYLPSISKGLIPCRFLQDDRFLLRIILILGPKIGKTGTISTEGPLNISVSYAP